MDHNAEHLTAKIVIVGGGIAGISTASQLCKAGETDFYLIEARDRLGGRIFTKDHGNGAIDIGAQFIHGAEGNPVYELAIQLNNIADDECSSDSSCMGSSTDSEEEWLKTCTFYTSDGKMLEPAKVKAVHDHIEGILDECNKFSRENFPNAAGDSIGTFLHREFYKYLRTNNDSSEECHMKEGIFNWRLLYENTENACRSIYELSLHAWGEYMECAGESDIELKHGFRPILEEVLKPVPQDRLILNTPVTAIYWDTDNCQPPPPRTNGDKRYNNDYLKSTLLDTQYVPKEPVVSKKGEKNPGAKVVIVTEKGTTITADHVVVTCPLGYLKRHVHSLFKPLLPNDKVSAIHRMGFGTVDKIFLEFTEPFWDKDCQGICFVWMPDDRFVLNCVENAHYSEYLHHDWYRAIWGFHPVAGHPTLLEGWVAADEARIMETVPDHVVRDICHELLQRFTGDTSIPRPTAIIRSCWYRDPYTWGSYTYIKDGSTAEDCDTLAEPLPSRELPLLMFAGEATHRTYFSTVHGALLSGQREADRILSHLRCKNA